VVKNKFLREFESLSLTIGKNGAKPGLWRTELGNAAQELSENCVDPPQAIKI